MIKGRFKSFEFWDGAIFGSFLATVGALIIVALNDLSMLEKYQTIIGAIIASSMALAGARWAYKGIQEQISKTESLNTEARLKEFIAARSVLPLALSELYEYSSELLRFGLRGLAAIENNDRDQEFQYPQLPNATIEVIQTCIRFGPPETITELGKLVSMIQFSDARGKGFKRDLEGERHEFDNAHHILGPYNAHHLTTTAALLSAEINRWFEYSRFKNENCPPSATLDDCHTSLRYVGIREENYAEVFENVKWSFPDDQWPDRYRDNAE